MRTSSQLKVRTISYAPESIRPSARRPTLIANPAWILCRRRYQYPIEDESLLRQWTSQGHIQPCDYLVSPRLDCCVQARDIAELNTIFRKATSRRLEKITRGLLLGGLLLVALAPLLAGMLFASAIGTAVSSIRVLTPIHREGQLELAPESAT